MFLSPSYREQGEGKGEFSEGFICQRGFKINALAKKIKV